MKNPTPIYRTRKFVNDSYAFLNKELELLDPQIMEPLMGTDWPRDMPVRTGGGFVENVSVIDVAYASSGENGDALFVENGNDIPIIQADFDKQTAQVFNFKEVMRIDYIEQQKFKKLATNLEDTLNKGIRLHLDKYIDQNVYLGFPRAKTTGLLNNPSIAHGSAATGASGSTDWDHKTPDEILEDVNKALSDVWSDNDCATDALPNHILVPVDQYRMLVGRKVSHDSERNILTFILENNICAQQGVDLVISPSKYLKGLGANNSGRMVVYRNAEDRVRFTQTVPLTRLQTEIHNVSFNTPFISQFSEVQFIYPSTLRYVDGI